MIEKALIGLQLQSSTPQVKDIVATIIANITSGYNLIMGALNGTSLTTTPNMIGCINAASFIYQGGVKTYNQVLSNLTIFGVLNAINIALDPVYHIADINYSCFVGAQEAYG